MSILSIPDDFLFTLVAKICTSFRSTYDRLRHRPSNLLTNSEWILNHSYRNITPHVKWNALIRCQRNNS